MTTNGDPSAVQSYGDLDSIAGSWTDCNMWRITSEVLIVQDSLDILLDERLTHVSEQATHFYMGK